MSKIKTYEAIYDEGKENVYSISLVEDPAMQSRFIALNKHEKKRIQFAEVDKKERTLLGVVLIPDKPIYRNQKNEEFYITFPKETIQASAHNFFKRGFQLNSKLQHENEIEGISFCESWIVKDPKNDTANAYGLDKNDIVEGAWVIKMKCDNDEIYQKALTNEINGFSIDGLFQLQEINLNLNKVEMAEEKKSFFDQVNEVLVSLNLVKEKVEFGSVMAGDVNIEFEGETLEVGAAVYVMQEEQRVALPDGEYPLDDGRVLVAKDGMAESVGEAPAAEPEQEVAASEPSVPSATDAVQAIKSLLIKYNEDIDAKLDAQKVEFNKSLEALNTENEKLKDEVVELSKQPTANPIRTEVRQVELTKKGRILQSLRNNK